MKVLQINAVYGYGSTGRNVEEMHKYFLSKGIESYVAYSVGQSANDKGLYHIGNNLDTKIHGLMSRISGKQGYFSVLSTKKLLQYIDTIKPDIVHLNNLHGNFINLPMLLRYLAEKKIATVVTMHDFWFITGKCVHFTTAGCYKWQTECGSCPNLKSGNQTWFFDRTKFLLKDKIELFSKIDRLAIVGVSDWVVNETKKSPISKNAKIIKRIYNWIDFNKFYPRDFTLEKEKLGLKDKFIILGVASGWAIGKGIEDFIELSKKIDDLQKIVIVGNVPPEIKLPNNIINIPSTNSTDELATYYSMADVFVTLSLEETFGKVSAEALASGTPVICYNSTANPELIGQNCGYVVEKNNVDEILKAVKEVFKNGKDYYSSSCRDFVLKNFNKDTCIDDTIKLYKELLTKKD